jgi:hypothetical protein
MSCRRRRTVGGRSARPSAPGKTRLSSRLMLRVFHQPLRSSTTSEIRSRLVSHGSLVCSRQPRCSSDELTGGRPRRGRRPTCRRRRLGSRGGRRVRPVGRGIGTRGSAGRARKQDDAVSAPACIAQSLRNPRVHLLTLPATGPGAKAYSNWHSKYAITRPC